MFRSRRFSWYFHFYLIHAMSCYPMGWYWGDILLVCLCPFFAGGPTGLVCFQILYYVACFKSLLNVKVSLMVHYCKSQCCFHFLDIVLCLVQVSLPQNKTAFKVMLWSLNFKLVVVQFPKYCLIIAFILLYLSCSFIMSFSSPNIKFPK